LWLQLSKHFWQISCGNVFLNVILQSWNKELKSKLEKANQRKWSIIVFFFWNLNCINIWISTIPLFLLPFQHCVLSLSILSGFWKGFRICWLWSTSYWSHRSLQHAGPWQTWKRELTTANGASVARQLALRSRSYSAHIWTLSDSKLYTAWTKPPGISHISNGSTENLADPESSHFAVGR
jgi:hypothetical protein